MFLYALNIYVSTHVSLLPTFVCFSVWMCVQPQVAEMNVTDREIWSKQKAEPGIHRVWETVPSISEMVLFKTGMRKGWPVTAHDSVFTNWDLHQET